MPAGSALPLSAGAYVAAMRGPNAAAIAVALLALWFGAEALLARAAGWHLSWRLPFALLLRDLMLPMLWVAAWLGNDFVWRGTKMNMRAKTGDEEQPLSVNP